MSRQFWSETVAWATAAGTAVASSAVETILIPNVTIPANFMQDGRILRVKATGAYGTHSATTGFTMAMRWGGVAGTHITESAVNVLSVSFGGGASMTGLWEMEVIIQTRSNGATGTLFSNGHAIFYSAALTTGGTVLNYGMPVPLVSGTGGGATPVVATVDLTADTALSLTGLWATSNAANSIRCDTYIVEALN